jgi:hypothetical protein
MKKFISFFICGYLFISPALALNNETETEEEKSSVSIDGASYGFIFDWEKDKPKARESHWTGMGFAFSEMDKLPKGVDLKLDRSYSVILNLIDYNVPLSHHWLVGSGLGFDFSRYHFDRNIALQAIDGITQFVADPEGRSYRDSKFIINRATIPLLLEYQTKSFFVYGGVEGLVKLYSKSQAQIRTPDGIQKTNIEDLNLLPLNYRFIARIGFDKFSVFGYYQPHSIFEKSKGPNIDMHGLGMMLNF